MIRFLRASARASAVVLALLLAAAPARAQDLSSEIASRVGQTIDLRTNHEIREQLVAHGIITPTTFSLHVTPDYEPPIDYGTGPFPADGLPLELRPL